MPPQPSHEQTLACILDTVLDAVVTVDAGLRIRLFNRAAGELFGCAPSSMLGEPLDRLIPPASRALHAARVAGFAGRGATARPMGSTQMLTALRADGTEIPIEASISRVGVGPDMLMTAVIRDARKQRALEVAKEAYVSAEAAHRAKMEFLSRMSHELRTPLNAVLGLTQLLQRSMHDRASDEERAQIGLVVAAGQRLRSLFDDMLATGALSAEGPEPAAGLPEAEPAGHVLYIEDEPVNALVVVELLRRWPKVRVTVAPDGQTGLAMARAQQPDLVMLDMHLPDMKGLQVLRRLRDDEETRHLRVVVLSAGGTPEEIAATLAAGAARYWTKPIDFGPFLSGLRELLPSVHS